MNDCGTAVLPLRSHVSHNFIIFVFDEAHTPAFHCCCVTSCYRSRHTTDKTLSPRVSGGGELNRTITPKHCPLRCERCEAMCLQYSSTQIPVYSRWCDKKRIFSSLFFVFVFFFFSLKLYTYVSCIILLRILYIAYMI